jgi:tetratricopeptide (TPR) repeat protein
MKIKATEHQYQEVLGQINALAKQGRFARALAKMLDSSSQKLRAEYGLDANHSWYVIGDLYSKMNDFSRALLAFRRALRSWPEDVQSLWAIGDCYSALEQHKFAERYYRRALDITPKNKELIYNIANSLFDQKRYEDAISMYKRVGSGSVRLSASAFKNMKLALQRLRASNS